MVHQYSQKLLCRDLGRFSCHRSSSTVIYFHDFSYPTHHRPASPGPSSQFPVCYALDQPWEILLFQQTFGGVIRPGPALFYLNSRVVYELRIGLRITNGSTILLCFFPDSWFFHRVIHVEFERAVFFVDIQSINESCFVIVALFRLSPGFVGPFFFAATTGAAPNAAIKLFCFGSW